MTRCFALPCHDVAVTTKLLMKSAERSTKWCHSNDDEPEYAVQRLNMLSNTAEQKAYVTPTVIYGAWRTSALKRNEDPASPSKMKHATRRKEHLHRREDASPASRRRHRPPPPKAAEDQSCVFYRSTGDVDVQAKYHVPLGADGGTWLGPAYP